MSVELVTFDGGNLSPKRDAMWRKNTQVDGVIYGCELTHLGSNQVQISAGWINVRGRLVEVLQETILCELATSGTMDGRIYLKLDLADATTPAELLTVAATTLPDLEQDDDFNETNGIWEMELGIYDTSTTAISNLDTTYHSVLQSVESGTLLWENPSPTSEFSKQTITLSEVIENFECYEIEYKYSNLSTIAYTTGKKSIEYGCILSIDTNKLNRRDTSVPSGTTLTFEDAYLYDSYGQTQSTVTTTGIIPIKVFGYKYR